MTIKTKILFFCFGIVAFITSGCLDPIGQIDEDTSTGTDSNTNNETDDSDSQIKGSDSNSDTESNDSDTGIPDCDDKLDCTTDILLDDNTCENTLKKTFCLLDGVCVSDGDTHPDNPCLSCDVSIASDALQKAAEGSECGFCRQCSATATCDVIPTCCDLNDLEFDNSACGRLSGGSRLVAGDCTASTNSTEHTSNYTSSAGNGFDCVNGSWQPVGGGSNSTAASVDYSANYKIGLNSISCTETGEDMELTCSDFCRMDTIPWEVRIGRCSEYPFNPHGIIANGGVAGIRKCEPYSSECDEISVTCKDRLWVNLQTKKATPPETKNETDYIDVWFTKTGTDEKIVQTEPCASPSCQVLSLGLQLSKMGYYYADGGTYESSATTFEPGNIFYVSTSVTIPGYSSGSSTNDYKCLWDGSWESVSANSGGGANCPICTTYKRTSTWKKQTAEGEPVVEVLDKTAYDSCNTIDADNYTYSTITGPDQFVPYGESLSRCIYSDGVLDTSSLYACSVDTPRVWTDWGEESRCPPTVEDLNAQAEADSRMDSCTTDNCVYWRSSYGNYSKTADY